MSGIILVIEDEKDLADVLHYNLSQEGYEVRLAHTGKAGISEAKKQPIPDVVLLDLMLPDMSGIEVCRRFRADKNLQQMSIIMVTAKSEEIDRVVGFEVGADDYVVKPFSARELMLRVRAVRRRTQTSQVNEEVQIRFGPFLIDQAAYRVWADGVELDLTALEFRLLSTMLTRRGQVQTRSVLLADVWNMDPDINTRTVDKHVQRLRQKLGKEGAFIETIRGVGYRFQSRD